MSNDQWKPPVTVPEKEPSGNRVTVHKAWVNPIPRAPALQGVKPAQTIPGCDQCERWPRGASPFERLGFEIGTLVTEKQRQYGDSAGKAGAIMRILYPEGIPVHAYDDALLMVRVLDKLSRLAQRGEDGEDLGGESPWRDIAGYALLGIAKDIDHG